MSNATTPQRRIRVLQVISGMHIGGAEQVIMEIVQGLDRNRFDVGVCCTRGLGVLGEQLKTEGVDVMLAKPPSRHLRHLIPVYLYRNIRRFRADIVHSHTTPTMLHVGMLGALRLLPSWVHTFHFGRYDDGAASSARRHERYLSRSAKQLVAVSESQRLALIEHHGVAPGHIMTIANGVRRVTPLDGADIAAARADLGFRPDHLLIGCIAVLTEQKGITYLLDSAKQLSELLPHARFLIIGGGPLEQPLRERAVSLGLADRVAFTGWKQDAARLLPAFDVFVMSSLWEAMPMALLEAMAARRPIIVTDVGDNRAIVDNGRCAVVIAPGDATAITDAVQRIVGTPLETAAMASRAQQRFDQRFTTRHMVGAHEELYERMVHRGRIPAIVSEHVKSLGTHPDGARAK